MMKRRLGLLLAALLVSLPGIAQERPQDYALRLPLEVSGEGPWYRVDLPISVYWSARYGDLRDVRVFDQAGQVQAYSLIVGQSETTRQDLEHQVRAFPLYADYSADNAVTLKVQRGTDGTLIELKDTEQPDSRSELRGWLLDASGIDDPLVALSLGWDAGLEGFQRFSIEASDDLQRWRHWGQGQVVRLSLGSERVEQRQVELPGRSARYLRLLWQAPQQAPQLDTAVLHSRHSASQPAPLIWSAPLLPDRIRSGQLNWELPLPLPVEKIRVALEQPNTLVPVQLHGRVDKTRNARLYTRGLLYRLQENGQEIRQDELKLPGWPVRELQMTIDERGGGLNADTATLQVAVRASQLVFLARGEGPFTLAVGRQNGRSATLPMNTLIPGYQSGRLAQLPVARVLEPEQVSGLADAELPRQDWQRYALWGVLIMGVLLLALMALSLLRRSPPQAGD